MRGTGYLLHAACRTPVFLVIDMMNGGVSKNMSLSMPLVRWFAYALYLSRPGFNIMPLI